MYHVTRFIVRILVYYKNRKKIDLKKAKRKKHPALYVFIAWNFQQSVLLLLTSTVSNEQKYIHYLVKLNKRNR